MPATFRMDMRSHASGRPYVSLTRVWQSTKAAKSAQWKSLAEVRRTYSHADGVKVGDVVYTVFNICGNHYRLITEIFYKDRTILVRHVLTHEEYDEEAWKQ